MTEASVKEKKNQPEQDLSKKRRRKNEKKIICNHVSSYDDGIHDRMRPGKNK